MSARERRIEPDGLVGLATERRGGKIEFGSDGISESGPQSARGEVRRRAGGYQVRSPGDLEFEVTGTARIGVMNERKMLWIEDRVHSLFTPEAKRESSNVQGQASGGSVVAARYLVVCWHW